MSDRYDDDYYVTAKGVRRPTPELAKKYADSHHMDLGVDGDGRPMAKNRSHEQPLPMPTKAGDVVITHVAQRFQVWTVTKDGAQESDAFGNPNDYWSADDASLDAVTRLSNTSGRVFCLYRRLIDTWIWSVEE